MYKNFRDFRVWEKADVLVKDIYKTHFKFSDNEKYGLESQIKRAAVSVPANIAEGCERRNNKEFVQFLYISKASLSEVTYYLLLCFELEFINKQDYEHLNDQCDQINRMLAKLISKINV